MPESIKQLIEKDIATLKERLSHLEHVVDVINSYRSGVSLVHTDDDYKEIPKSSTRKSRKRPKKTYVRSYPKTVERFLWEFAQYSKKPFRAQDVVKFIKNAYKVSLHLHSVQTELSRQCRRGNLERQRVGWYVNCTMMEPSNKR